MSTEEPPNSNVPTDEREGLPSASGADIIYECPGGRAAQEAEQAAGNYGEETQVAADGTLIHKSLETEGNDPEVEKQLKLDHKMTRDQCAELAWELIAKTFGESNADSLEHYKEDRIWFKDEDGKKLSSCKYDWLVIDRAGNRALVIDYKTGRGEVGFAGGHKQSRVNVVTIRQVFGINDITAAIVQPHAEERSE